jgi:hypothetical protein
MMVSVTHGAVSAVVQPGLMQWRSCLPRSRSWTVLSAYSAWRCIASFNLGRLVGNSAGLPASRGSAGPRPGGGRRGAHGGVRLRGKQDWRRASSDGAAGTLGSVKHRALPATALASPVARDQHKLVSTTRAEEVQDATRRWRQPNVGRFDGREQRRTWEREQMSQFALIGGGRRAQFIAGTAAELSKQRALGRCRDRRRGASAHGEDWPVRPRRASRSSTSPLSLSPPSPPSPRHAVRRGACRPMRDASRSGLDGLVAVCELARQGPPIQVAEQYPMEPLHAARIELCRRA